MERYITTALGVTALLLGLQTPAQAAPSNDDFAAAVTVASVPFSTTVTTTGATADPTDPAGCQNAGSVWFSYTPPRDGRLRAGTTDSDYDTVLSAWTGEQGALTQVACNDNEGLLTSAVGFVVTAGTTYHFMVGANDSGGILKFRISVIDAPANDDFAAATTITALPYAHEQTYRGATREVREPRSCGSGEQTAWYSYTPATTGPITAGAGGYGEVAAYLGSTLPGLVLAGCAPSYGPMTFVAQAGRTYWFQVTSSDEATFRLEATPPPGVEIPPPSIPPNSLEPTSFSSNAWDPGNLGLTYAWNFGDGSTSTEANPVHQFAADGDFQVRLTVTTTDGRTASTTRLIEVRTHDVAVTRVTAPARARVGETVTVTATIRNTRYDETVLVDLYRNDPSAGSVPVDSSTKPVPARRSGTTRFSFPYKVTTADRAAGPLTFRATADPAPNRDAHLPDNDRTSTPMTIR